MSRSSVHVDHPSSQRKISARILTSAAMLAALSSAAFAQAGIPDLKSQAPEGAKPPAESTVPPTDPSTGDTRPEVPLTEKLKEGEGVLEPPRGMDPEIHKEAPVPNPEPGSKSPVIPPAGEPGGDPDIQPK